MTEQPRGHLVNRSQVVAATFLVLVFLVLYLVSFHLFKVLLEEHVLLLEQTVLLFDGCDVLGIIEQLLDDVFYHDA